MTYDHGRYLARFRAAVANIRRYRNVFYGMRVKALVIKIYHKNVLVVRGDNAILLSPRHGIFSTVVAIS